MPAFGTAPFPSQSTTPGRVTELVFDGSRNELAELPSSNHRSGFDIRPVSRKGLHQLPDGSWTMEPLQVRTETVTEVIGPSTIRAPDVNLSPQWEEKPGSRQPSELPGATDGASGSWAGSGAFSFRRQIGSGQSAHDGAFSSDKAAFPQPTTQTIGDVMDRMMVGRVTYPADTAFSVRWLQNGAKTNSREIVFAVAFGGPTMRDGGGSFYLTFSSDGIAILYVQLGGDGPLTWYEVDRFRYNMPNQNFDSYQQIIIRPFR